MELGKVLYNRLAMEAVDQQVKDLGEARIKRWEKALEAEVEAVEPKSCDPFGRGGHYQDEIWGMSEADVLYLVMEEQPAKRAFWPFPTSGAIPCEGYSQLILPEDQA